MSHNRTVLFQVRPDLRHGFRPWFSHNGGRTWTYYSATLPSRSRARDVARMYIREKYKAEPIEQEMKR